jgi:hypothetical protein
MNESQESRPWTSKWNKSDVQANFGACLNLAQVIDQLEKEISARGEVICEIAINGVLLEDGDEARMAERPRQAIEEIAIRTDRPENLIRQAMQSTHSFIPLLTEASLSTAHSFRDGRWQQAAEQFREAIEGCHWFVETLLHARGAASGTGQPVRGAERWHEAEKMLFRVVQELTEAYDRKDYVLTADLLEYELTAALEMWEPVIRQQSSWVQA